MIYVKTRGNDIAMYLERAFGFEVIRDGPPPKNAISYEDDVGRVAELIAGRKPKERCVCFVENGGYHAA